MSPSFSGFAGIIAVIAQLLVTLAVPVVLFYASSVRRELRDLTESLTRFQIDVAGRLARLEGRGT